MNSGRWIYFLYKLDSETEPRICSVPASAIPISFMGTGEIETFVYDFALDGFVVPIPFVFEKLQSGGYFSAVDTQHIRHLGIGDYEMDATTFPDYESSRKQLIEWQTLPQATDHQPEKES